MIERRRPTPITIALLTVTFILIFFYSETPNAQEQKSNRLVGGNTHDPLPIEPLSLLDRLQLVLASSFSAVV